jgi:long-chain acyl-CoA synthetase
VNVEQFGQLAGRVIARLAKQVELSIAPLELTLPQYRLLGHLADGAEAASALAERMAVKPPTVTSLVDGLVARGFVVRSSDPEDRRRLPLELTATGRDLLGRANTAVGERLADVLGHLDDRDERAAVKHGLAGWQTALDAVRDARRAAGVAR